MQSHDAEICIQDLQHLCCSFLRSLLLDCNSDEAPFWIVQNLLLGWLVLLQTCTLSLASKCWDVVANAAIASSDNKENNSSISNSFSKRSKLANAADPNPRALPGLLTFSLNLSGICGTTKVTHQEMRSEPILTRHGDNLMLLQRSLVFTLRRRFDWDSLPVVEAFQM